MLHNFQADRKQFAATFVRGMYHKPQPESYLESVTAASLKTPTNSGVAMLAEFAVKNDLRPVLPKLTIPVLAVMTENNRCCGGTHQSSVPGAQGGSIRGCGPLPVRRRCGQI